MRPQPPVARKHYLWSAALAQRAAREARSAQSMGSRAVAGVVAAHQATAAYQADAVTSQALAEQDVDAAAQALLNSSAFTTGTESFARMVDEVSTATAFDQLVTSLVQDAARLAEQVAVTVRPGVGYVRYLNPPSCARCAVLAGRVYRYSEGFLRHPRCDCTMSPTSLSDPITPQDSVELVRTGMVRGLSRADEHAVNDGADLGQVVNVRLRKAGLTTAGRVLTRRGRPTPEAIYATARTREEAIGQLIAAGYIRA